MIQLACLLSVASVVLGQPSEPLASYFGFEPSRTIVVDDGCGPVVSGDFNGDGRPDLAIVNNRKSRIELYMMRATPRTAAMIQREYDVNEIPPSEWYDREQVSVSHAIGGLAARDFDGDGLLDLAYSGNNPAEIVILRQSEGTTFAIHSRRRVSGLSNEENAFDVANVMGDARPELLAIANQEICVFPLDEDGRIGQPETLGSGSDLRFLEVADVQGDGLDDVIGVVPDDVSPVRVWLQRSGGDGQTRLATEYRFEMPGLAELESVRFEGREAASLAIIERSSRRIALLDFEMEAIEPLDLSRVTLAERDVVGEVLAFADGVEKERSVAVGDLDGDGAVDLLATNRSGNAVVWHRQSGGIGLEPGKSFSSFKAPLKIAVGQWEGDEAPEVFVLSEDEKAVGVCRFDRERELLSFPQPLPLAAAADGGREGAAPVAMQLLELGGEPVVAIVVKVRRDYALELHRPGTSDVQTIELDGVSRQPGSIVAADADQDGTTDLLVLTPGAPLVMVRPESGEVLTDASMPQFGFVDAAGPSNTVVFDVDGDGVEELLIADENFVRACVYDPDTGWRVTQQVNVPDQGVGLTGLSTLDVDGEMVLVASDRPGGRLLLLGTSEDGQWDVLDRIRVLGFPIGSIRGGAFGGDGQPSVLCMSDAAFALVRLGGERPVLRTVTETRPADEDRIEHEIESGDVNGDGYTDIVTLDAAEQMCAIYTFSASRKIHAATEFEVFQTRLFSRGNSREYEPRRALVGDVTGDGADDLTMVVHDRVVVYPQKTSR